LVPQRSTKPQNRLCLFLGFLCLLVANFAVASGQIDPIRERGVHTLYGDIRVETEPGDDSKKPLSLEVQLYIIGGTLIGRQNVGANGRYRFMELRNGEYDVVVLSENLEVARVRVRVESVYKTDFRQDITLEARTDRAANRAATISASDVYERTSANKSLFAKAQKAVDEKKYDEAMDLFSRLLAVDAKDFQAWTELGTVQLMRNQIEEAEKDYRRAIQERPTFTLALLNLGRVLSAQKKFEEAGRAYERLAADYPKAKNVQYAHGRFLLVSNEQERAVEAFRREIENDPKRLQARLLIADTLLRRREFAEGLPYAEQAVALSPRLALAHYLLGSLLLGTGDATRGKRIFFAGGCSSCHEPRLHYALSQAYERAGRKDDARRALATFARLKGQSEKH